MSEAYIDDNPDLAGAQGWEPVYPGGIEGNPLSNLDVAQLSRELHRTVHGILTDKHHGMRGRTRLITHAVLATYATTIEAAPESTLDIATIDECVDFALTLQQHRDTETQLDLELLETNIAADSDISPVSLADSIKKAYSLYPEADHALLAVRLWVLHHMDPQQAGTLTTTHFDRLQAAFKRNGSQTPRPRGFSLDA